MVNITETVTETLNAPTQITEIPGPRSRELHERRLKALPHGVTWALPIYIDRAEGSQVIDVDGNHYIDMGSGIGVTTVGHANPAVVSAAKEQLEKVWHTLFTITPYEGYVRLAELLDEKTPGNFEKKSFFVNSGSEAVENAVKIARKYTGRRAVVALDHAFHGRTNLTIAMNHKIAPYGTGFGPFASDIFRVPNSYPFRDGLTGEEAAERTIKYMETRIGAQDIAALIFEPIQGEGGFVVPADGYLNRLQEWANENGTVFIADEIQCGLARTGKWFASEHFGITPDIVLTAKGIAGGLPLAGVTGRAEIMDNTYPGSLGGTFGGNPVAVAAAIAVFEQFDTSLIARAVEIGEVLGAGLRELQQKYPVIAEVRGIGAMQAFELTEPGTHNVIEGLNARIVDELAQRGVIALTAGSLGSVVRFLPTLQISDAEIRYALSQLDEIFTNLDI